MAYPYRSSSQGRTLSSQQTFLVSQIKIRQCECDIEFGLLFRRHDNCDCVIIYDGKVLRGQVGSSGKRTRTWEDTGERAARIEYAESKKPAVLSREEAERLQGEHMPEGLTKERINAIINNREGGIVRISMQFFAEKDIEKQESNSLKRAIRKYQKRIEEHEEYINNPVSHCPDWENYSDFKKQGLVKHWKKEISNFRESIENRVVELKKRGDYDE